MTVRNHPLFISITEVVVGGALALLYEFVLHNPSAAWVVFGVSLLLALASHQIMIALTSKLREFSELHGLLDSIEDPELQLRGRNMMNDCRDRLLQLGEGSALLNMDGIIQEVTKLFRQMKRGSVVQAIHLSEDGIDRTKIWEDDPRFRNLMEEQRQAIARGVAVERVFILPRQSAIEDGNVVKRHADIGVHVHVVWGDTIADDLKEDLLIFDNQVLVRAEWITDGRIQRGSMTRVQRIVRTYQEKYDMLLRAAVGGAEVLS